MRVRAGRVHHSVDGDRDNGVRVARRCSAHLLPPGPTDRLVLRRHRRRDARLRLLRRSHRLRRRHRVAGNRSNFYYTHTHTHTRLMAFFRDYPGEPVPERQNQSGFY